MTGSMRRALTSEIGPTGPGQALGWLRVHAGLSLDEVAREACVSPKFLSRVETGTLTATPAWLGVVAETIARHLGPVDRETERRARWPHCAAGAGRDGAK